MTEILLYGLLPLVFFVLVDVLSKNLTIAVACAVFCAVVEMCAIRFSSGYWDTMSLVSVALFSICGLFAIRSKKRIYFKYQPVLFAGVAAAFVGYLQFFDESVISRYLPLLKQTAPPNVLQYLEQPQFVDLIDHMFDWLVLAIVLDGLLIAYAARRCGDVVWLAANAFGFWLVGGMMLFSYIGYLLFTGSSPV